MTATATVKPMAKKGRGQEPQKTTMKVAADVLRKARMVAIHKGEDLFDYTDAILRPRVEADYQRMIRDEAGGAGK
jgi:hypothetical protein